MFHKKEKKSKDKGQHGSKAHEGKLL